MNLITTPLCEKDNIDLSQHSSTGGALDIISDFKPFITNIPLFTSSYFNLSDYKATTIDFYVVCNYFIDTLTNLDIRLKAQLEGGFIALSNKYLGAIGQGETEEEAIQDINFAIELLMEEEKNPSGEKEWPKDFQ